MENHPKGTRFMRTRNMEAMRKWALQYAVHIKVISPKKLVDMVKEDITSAIKQYEGEE